VDNLKGGKDMGTKILWQDIWTRDIPLLGIEDSGPMYEAMNELLFKKVAREDTQIQIRHVKRSSYMVMSSYLELLNNVELIGEIIQAEKEGFDAAIIGCGNDPGLYQAREVVSIPVVGPTETAMHLACLLGGKFAVITIIKRLVPLVERNLKLYGLESRAIDRKPVRSCEVGYEFTKWFLPPSNIGEYIIPSFEKVAKECIDEGAEVIVVACCGLGPALTMAGYNKVAGTEVPVIDCASVAIKMAELLADVRKSLGISTSKSLTYQSLPKEVIEKLQRPFYL
jgi:allantoin racemase